MLQQDEYAPYLIVKGSFLASYIVFWLACPVVMFFLFFCFYLGSNRLITESTEAQADSMLNQNDMRRAGVGMVSLNQTHR